MEGKASVLRLPSTFDEDTSAIRRMAPRNVFVMFMSFFFLMCGAGCPRPPCRKTGVQVEQGFGPAISALK